MRKNVTISSVITLVFLAVSGLQAQDRGPRVHEGVWISFGIGGGFSLSEGFDEDPLGGAAGYFRLGGAINQRFLIGVDRTGWVSDDEGETVSRGNTTVVGIFYPSEEGGAFVKLGIGLSDGQGTVFDVIEADDDNEVGFAMTLGAGYDIRLGKNFYLTPNLDWLFQVFDDAGGTGTHNILLVTVGATWH